MNENPYRDPKYRPAGGWPSWFRAAASTSTSQRGAVASGAHPLGYALAVDNEELEPGDFKRAALLRDRCQTCARCERRTSGDSRRYRCTLAGAEVRSYWHACEHFERGSA